ncbi:hypothetical protein PMI04_009115 [Sphingobium sp. AP49]|uniref:hypothetical protein n=1 Tax=Sphingobium sp. AP49 TaxID=1144307 RepID=UPI00026EE704|nr:hypothetical protein [Sphingobium sp. AP49]WHO40728.1 hypothetical protein PMI04_009115 [Sphingobium sp. AP49]
MRDPNARLCDPSHGHLPIIAPLHQVMQAFHVLHRIEWRAPWSDDKPCSTACRS